MAGTYSSNGHETSDDIRLTGLHQRTSTQFIHRLIHAQHRWVPLVPELSALFYCILTATLFREIPLDAFIDFFGKQFDTISVVVSHLGIGRR